MHRRRLGHHGGQVDQGHRRRPSWQHVAHGRNSGGADHNVRAHLRRAFQSGRKLGDGHPPRAALVKPWALCPCANRGRLRRHHCCPCHVRPRPVPGINDGAHRLASVVRRVCCGVRIGPHHHRRRPHAPRHGCGGGWPLYHRGLLVHGLDLVRKSRRHHCTGAVGHLRWHSARPCGCIHRGSDPGSARGHGGGDQIFSDEPRPK